MMIPTYDPILTHSMEKELGELGVIPLKSTEEVDEALKKYGTTLLVINSICGCAAGCCRPGVKLALKNEKRPENMYTVFAGVDIEATNHARSYIKDYQPSSPSIGILKGGEVIFFMERQDIEGRKPEQIAELLINAFNKFC